MCCMCAQSCSTLLDPVDCCPPGSSVHGIFPARIMEWIAISSSRGSTWPKDWSCVSCISCIGRRILYPWATSEVLCRWCFSVNIIVFPFSLGILLSQSAQFSHLVVSKSLRPHESQHARPPCPSPTPGVHSNSCPLSQWCHPAISSSVVPFSSCPQSLTASGSFQTSQLFTWSGQSIGDSASALVLPMNTQDWSPSEWTGWISLQSRGLSRVFSNTTVQRHQFFGTQLSSQCNSYIHTWLLEKP